MYTVMMTTVAGDENAIGYISLGSLDDTGKRFAVLLTGLIYGKWNLIAKRN